MEGHSYRSVGTPPGFFSRIGTVHLHVDGAHDFALARQAVQTLEAGGAPGKLTRITKFIAGPQRTEQPEVYGAHSPGTVGEEFEYFSTTLIRDRAEAVSATRQVLPMIAESPGTIVELERVIATIDTDGRWERLAEKGLEPVDGHEVGFATATRLPIEIHHAIDAGSNTPAPLTLKDLLELSRRCSMNVGGWFLFEKPGQCSYRSNEFSESQDVRQYVELQHAALTAALRGRGANCTVRTLVEQVLGVWKIPATPL